MSLRIFKSPTIAAGGNAKTVKGDSVYQTAIMYLAPFTMSGLGNTCAMAAIAQCHEGCLFSAGRAEIFTSVNAARIGKTKRYYASRSRFMAELVRDLEKFVRHCERQGVKPACRLNGTSDIQWEIAHPVERAGVNYASIFEAFGEVTFYDYTKIVKRAYRVLPVNYSLTLSYSGANPRYASDVIKAARETGTNMAVVYRTKTARNALMSEGHVFMGAPITEFGFNALHRPVINGDETDMRFLDPKGVIVGLYAKGKAGKADRSGFVVDIAA